MDEGKASSNVTSDEVRLRTIIDNLSVGVFSIDNRTGLLADVNPAFARILGYASVEEAIGAPVLGHYADPEERARTFAKYLADPQVLETGEEKLEAKRVRKDDGREIDVRMTVTTIMDDNGQVVRLDGILEDIEEQKRTEAELAKVEKLESLAVLAGGIAHDFNNILTAVLGNIGLAARQPPGSPATSQMLESAQLAAMRARDLTHQLMTFARGTGPRKKAGSLANLVRECADLCLRGSNVGYEIDLPIELSATAFDAGQLSQVFNNLFINADQAMPSGGMLHIALAGTAVTVGTGLPLQEGNYVTVSVTDSGAGIAEDHFDRIFDPFFSTKQKGTGLGLASAYSIVRQHDGHIHVESTLGIGSTFTVYLPVLAVAEIEDTDECVPASADLAAGARVLVMDDDRAIRDVIHRLLTSLGLEPDLAPEGHSAVEMFSLAKAEGRPYGAVLMDLTVPGGMGGLEALARIKEIDSEVMAVVSSGYSTDPVLSAYRDYGFAAAVSKPYTLAELRRAMAKVLSSPQP